MAKIKGLKPGDILGTSTTHGKVKSSKDDTMVITKDDKSDVSVAAGEVMVIIRYIPEADIGTDVPPIWSAT